jgi:hypothetical protein
MTRRRMRWVRFGITRQPFVGLESFCFPYDKCNGRTAYQGGGQQCNEHWFHEVPLCVVSVQQFLWMLVQDHVKFPSVIRARHQFLGLFKRDLPLLLHPILVEAVWHRQIFFVTLSNVRLRSSLSE